ncbi:MAG: DnaJ-class molecular chaperone [Paracoccaceae bacterium]
MADVQKDLYAVLGVARDATSDVIRKAYRALAKKHHPDLNPGDSAAEETFKEIQRANEILSDPEKRLQYDAGEIDAEGNETPQRYYREYADAGGEQPYSSSAGFDDIGDVFADLFGDRAGGTGRRGGARANIRMRGVDARYTLEVSFLEAAAGAKKRVNMPDGKSLDISIPAGQRDGQVLRLRGKGGPGVGGGESGDAYVEIHVAPHPLFRRHGADIHIDLPVAVNEAVLGAKVRVPTVSGPVAMTIPSASNTGDTLRLRGKGLPDAGNPAGDQIVTLRVVLPDAPDDALKDFMKSWAVDNAYDPRAGMEDAS